MSYEPDQPTKALVDSVCKSLEGLDDDQRHWFFVCLSSHYKTCCGTPSDGWCACFADG